MKNVIKGTSVFLVVSYTSTISSFLVLIVNGKILEPEDFGLLGLAMVLVSILESFKQLGFKEYLISKKHVHGNEEANAWSIDFLKSFFLALVLLVSLPFIVDYYNEPRIASIIYGFALIFAIEGFTSPKLYELRKDLNYSYLVRFNLYQNLIYATSSIFLVWYFESYVGVILSYIVKSICGLLLSYHFSPCRPKWLIDISITNVQFKYGVWLLASSLIFYFTNRFDTFVLSTNVELYQLGFYTFAYAVSNGLVAQPVKAFNNALFPILSRGDTARSPFYFLTCLMGVSLFAGSILIISVPFIMVELIDEKWAPAVVSVQILIAAFLVNGLKFDAFFMASGTTRYKFIVELVKGVAFVSSVFALVEHKGIEGAALANLFSNILSFVAWLIIMRKFNVQNSLAKVD